MTDAIKQSLRIIAFKEADVWIAQCVEYDICVQGADLPQVQRRMTAALQAECELGREQTGNPFGGIDPAPEVFEIMFNEAEANLTSELDFRIAA